MHPDTLRTARHWLVTSLEKGRDFIVLRDDIDWLNGLSDAAFEDIALNIRNLKPLPISFIQVPKNGGECRMAAVIPVRDRLVVTSLMVEQYQEMRARVTSCYMSDVDFQHPLPKDPNDATWIARYRDEYQRFRTQTEKFEDEGQIVFHADVKNFSGTADIDYLLNEMRDCGWSSENRATMKTYFRAWESQGLTGLPQGTVMGDVMSKYMFNYIDRMVIEMPGVTYYRYNDDIRIAGKNMGLLEEARAMLDVSLADAGLSFNSSKLRLNFKREGDVPFRLKDYFDIEAAPDGLAQEKLEAVYVEHIKPWGKDPHSTLFNFTMNRLAKAASAIAHDDLSDLVCPYGGSLALLVRYALTTGHRDMQGMHDALPETSARDYFKYLVLKELQHTPDSFAAHVEMLQSWLREGVPDFVRAKAIEVIPAAILQKQAYPMTVVPPAELQRRFA